MCNLSDYIESCALAKGELHGKKEVALNFLAEGDSYEKIAKCAGVSIETIKEWEQEALATV